MQTPVFLRCKSEYTDNAYQAFTLIKITFEYLYKLSMFSFCFSSLAFPLTPKFDGEQSSICGFGVKITVKKCLVGYGMNAVMPRI